MKTRYVRVRLKGGKSFWAVVESKNSRVTLYQKTNNEGDAVSHWDAKVKADVLHKELVSNSLIVSEKPAIESWLYGWLVLDNPRNRAINKQIGNTTSRKR